MSSNQIFNLINEEKFEELNASGEASYYQENHHQPLLSSIREGTVRPQYGAVSNRPLKLERPSDTTPSVEENQNVKYHVNVCLNSEDNSECCDIQEVDSFNANLISGLH